MNGEPVNQFPDLNYQLYVQKCLREWLNTKKFSTLTKYKSDASKLARYRANFNLSDITPAFLKGYLYYCYSIKNQSATVWRSFKFLRTIILKALREKLIRKNPFHIFPMPAYCNPRKNYLTAEQVKAIEVLLPEIKGIQRHAVVWFLIGCYTGFRYGDMNTFDKATQVKSGRLVVYTEKTDEVVSMPVSERLKKWFEMVDYKPLAITNQAYNRHLKEIAKNVISK